MAATRRFYGLLTRRERWGLSWRGRLALLLLFVLVAWAWLHNIHQFLAPTNRVDSSILIVEGWIPPGTMRQAAAEFHLGSYHHVILLRPIVDVADKYASGRYTGDYMANLLIAAGVPQAEETTLFPVVAQKDRTYHSALAARQWLAEHGMAVKSLDVATLGPHARRSRLMYEQAFGAHVKIGIIAFTTSEYDPDHWWRSSEGVREVIGEIIAYGYAKCLFWPPTPKN